MLPNVVARAGDVMDQAGLAAILRGHDVAISSVHFLNSDPAKLISAAKVDELGDGVAGADRSWLDHPGIEAAQPELAALRRVHQSRGVTSEALVELGATGVGLGEDLDGGVAQPQSRARRQVRLGDVEVDIELVAGKGPPVAVAHEEGDARTFMIVIWRATSEDPSAVLLLPRCRQPSPTTPSSTLNWAAASSSRSPTVGRRTMSSTTPVSAGAAPMTSSPASNSSVVRWLTSTMLADRPAQGERIAEQQGGGEKPWEATGDGEGARRRPRPTGARAADDAAVPQATSDTKPTWSLGHSHWVPEAAGWLPIGRLSGTANAESFGARART